MVADQGHREDAFVFPVIAGRHTPIVETYVYTNTYENAASRCRVTRLKKTGADHGLFLFRLPA